MEKMITVEQLVERGMDPAAANELTQQINMHLREDSSAEAWRAISQSILRPEYPFAVHQFLYEVVFADWDTRTGPPPAWSPTREQIDATNTALSMKALNIGTYEDFHAWSIANREAFWSGAVERLQIEFRKPYSRLLDLTGGVESPRWLVGAQLNIVESCFHAASDSTAILYQREGGAMETMTIGQLARLTNRVANALGQQGFRPGDALAIDMPMTAESVAIYLGIIKAGCVAVSIADSFAPKEIAIRLKLGNAKGIFTQDVILRGGKTLPLYEKVVAADAPKAIVLTAGGSVAVPLRDSDLNWDQFLADNDQFDAVACDPDSHINILFSSGTTGEPKAIPWNHTTAIKCATDAYFHHDTHAGEVLAWPTNLGWMMGPWLIFASLINRATIALYYGAPTEREFGRFVQDARVTMLGVVPSMVKTWRNTECMKGLDWSGIKLFSSTGEASNTEDMLYLMSLAGYRPIVEYCGGTEIGGGYITGTLVRPSSPATFNTLALGLDAVILDEEGKPADNGELFLVPPSMGLSTELLNRDHKEVYFDGTPKGPHGERLRRHGDQMERLPNGYYRAHGRVDDTMNLGGIKVSSAEIERTLNTVEGIHETAAIAVDPKGGGPSELVIYAVRKPGAMQRKPELLAAMQNALKKELNPLFKIHDLVMVDTLPRTASNKVMRRVLRGQYEVK